MPKLPSNLVKPVPAAPTFDNPLRRTSADERAAIAESTTTIAEPMATVIALPVVPAAEPSLEPPTANATEEGPLNERISVRLDNLVFVALQTECYERRIRGEKTNVAEVAREVLGKWAQRRARR